MIRNTVRASLVFSLVVGIFIALGALFPQNQASLSPTLPGNKTVVGTSNLPAAEKLPNKTVVLKGERKAVGKLQAGAKVKKMPVIVLGKKNTLVFRQVVTPKSVAKLQRRLLDMSYRLKRSDTIYLVLNSPGGSISAGNLFLDTAKAVPQKIKTITIFSASMAYHMVQNLDDRIITPSGTLMSHRARVEGFGGEIPGEFNTRAEWLLRELLVMDARVAKRLKMSLADYRQMIRDEYWVNGQDAVKERSADRTALVRCGKDLKGTTEEEVRTFFGVVKLLYSECPMITHPVEVDMSDLDFPSITEKTSFERMLSALLNHKKRFVSEYVMSNKYSKFLQ